ncbi:MAG: PilZ domain-containing protein [Vicinamibacterales bacterium]
MGEEKRDAERVAMLGELRAEIMLFQPMVVTDLSRIGVTVETRFPLQIDSLHDIRLTLGDRSVVLKGRVAHSHVSDVDQVNVVYRTGLEFIEASKLATAAILEFLEATKTHRTGSASI